MHVQISWAGSFTTHIIVQERVEMAGKSDFEGLIGELKKHYLYWSDYDL